MSILNFYDDFHENRISAVTFAIVDEIEHGARQNTRGSYAVILIPYMQLFHFFDFWRNLLKMLKNLQ